MRAIEECPYRQSAEVAGEGACKLIGEITGLSRASALRVGDDACRACCEGPVPGPRQINPVLGMPQEIQILAILPFGYPLAVLGKGQKKRKPLGEVAHRETWGKTFI